MTKSILTSEPELRISPKPIFIALLVLGCLLFVGAEALSYPWQTVNRAISLSLLLSALAFVGILLVDWKPAVGRWFAVLTLVAIVHLADSWLSVPGSLAWATIPIVLTVPYFFGGGAFNIFLLRQFFRTIPEELADAARIDGCSEFSIYARIMLPLSKPALTTVAIFFSAPGTTLWGRCCTSTRPRGSPSP